MLPWRSWCAALPFRMLPERIRGPTPTASQPPTTTRLTRADEMGSDTAG